MAIDTTALEGRIDEAMDRLHVPGVAVGIWHDGEEGIVCRGVTNVDHPLPVDADTLFQIGSTTKTVTGTVVMRLVEARKLDLDAPVRTYLPDLQLADEDAAARVTLRHLLTHMGGWSGDYFDDFGMGDDALQRIVERLRDLPQLTPLNTIWAYNNAGFYIAGRVIEIVTGQTYEAAATELVLEPLGMRHSFCFPNDVMTHRFAVGHIVRDEQPVVARPWALPRTASPVGALASSARDQLRYARFHLGDGTAEDGSRLLSPESMRIMQTPQSPAGGLIKAMGITWMLREQGNLRIVQHGGATNGQMSAFVLVPDRRFAITALTNANRGAELGAEIVAWAMREVLSVAAPDPVPFIELDDAALAPYIGHYSSPMSEIELFVRDGVLQMQLTPKGAPGFEAPPPPPPMRLAFRDPDHAVVLDPPAKDAPAEFLRDEGGSLVWLRYGGRIRRRQ